MFARELLALMVMVAGASLLGAACGSHGTQSTMLVNGDWLEGHLHESKVVVLAVGNKDEYSAGHIPGSRFLDYSEVHTPTPPAGSSALTLELPPPAQVADVLGKAGVSDGSRIILYSTKDNASVTTRVYLTLDAMGLGASTSLLDGGLPEWRRQGRPVSQEVPATAAGRVQLCPQDDVVAGLSEVRSQVRKPKSAIVDARLPEFYTGEKVPAQRRAGHIPGAANIPFNSLLDEGGRLLPPAAMRSKFEKAGVQPGDRVISYCHIGQQATLVYFAARYLGYDAKVFDGSWQEWSAHEELPAETSAEKPPAAQR